MRIWMSWYFSGFESHNMLLLLSSLLTTFIIPNNVNIWKPLCGFNIDHSYESALCILHTKLEIGKYCSSGAVAGGCRAISRAFTFPLDTIKTLKQLNVTVNTNFSGKSTETSKLYSGLLPATLSAIPSSAVFFVAYNILQVCYDNCMNNYAVLETHVTSELSAIKLVRKILFSSLATVPQNAIKIPAEAIKQNLQYNNERKSIAALSGVMKSLIKSGEWKALYQGGNAQLLREVPYNALQMAFFDTLQENKPEHISIKLANWIIGFYELVSGHAGTANSEAAVALSNALSAATLGCVAACLAAVLTQPADVIKTRMTVQPTRLQPFSQISDGQDRTTDIEFCSEVPVNSATAAADSSHDVDNSITGDTCTLQTSPPTIGSVARQIWLSEGIDGYFVGLVPRLLIVSVGGAVYFLAASLVESLF